MSCAFSLSSKLLINIAHFKFNATVLLWMSWLAFPSTHLVEEEVFLNFVVPKWARDLLLKEEKELPPSVVPGYISSRATCGEWSRLPGGEGASSLRRAAPVSDQLHCDLLPPFQCSFPVWLPCPGVFPAQPCSRDPCGHAAPDAPVPRELWCSSTAPGAC